MMDIVFLTAVLRMENLPYIARNIVKTFENEKELRPVWVLCIDKYNSNYTQLDLKRLEVYLLENNIEYHIFFEGEEGKENYGGTLMNEPLKKLKETKYQSINPFVIVLDDDNILSGNFLKFIHDNCMDNEFTWWLNMLDECGTQRFARKCDRLAYVPSPSGKYNIIHRCSTFDPSQMLFRLDTLLCLGGFGRTYSYDFEMMNKFYNNVYDVDRRLHLQGDLTPISPNIEFYISCFHNGLVTPDMIDKTINDINDNNFSYEDSYLRVHVGKNMYTIQVPAKELIPLLEKYKKTVEL